MPHILITGTSRGIGLGLTQAYLARGARVTAVARAPAQSHGLSDLQARYPETLRTVACDLNDSDASATILASVADQAIDRLILNAGVPAPENQAVDHLTADDIGHLFLTNAIAPMRLVRALQAKVPAGGVVAFTSSNLGSVALGLSAELAVYGASKAALNSLIRKWVEEQGSNLNIKVLALHPGWVRTHMGGPQAPLTVEESVSGLVRVIEQAAGSIGCDFLDEAGNRIPW